MLSGIANAVAGPKPILSMIVTAFLDWALLVDGHSEAFNCQCGENLACLVLAVVLPIVLIVC